MKNVLVTGGCSRIGDHMCSGLLKKGYNVMAMDNKSSDYNRNKKHYQFILCDESVTDTLKYIFENYKLDAIVHLACTADNDMGPTFTE